MVAMPISVTLPTKPTSLMATHTSHCHLNLEKLPDLVVLNIFSYLKVRDLYNAGSVCRKWYHLSRSAEFWKYLHVKYVNYYSMMKLLPNLPSSVLHIKFGDGTSKFTIPLSLPQLMSELAVRCPSLKTLTIDRCVLSWSTMFDLKHKSVYCSNEDNLLELNYTDDYWQLVGTPRDFLEKEIQKYPVMVNLEVLSLRGILFNSMFFFLNVDDTVLPQIKILDFTGSSCGVPLAPVTLSELRNLQELYLPGTRIRSETLQAMTGCLKTLKVLDLERLAFESDVFFDILKDCQCLEKLYLGYSQLVNDSLLDLFEQHLFPRLTVLCLRRTSVSFRGFTDLKKSLNSLKIVLVGTFWVPEERSVRYKLNAPKKGFSCNVKFCDHFLENNCIFN